MRRFISHLRSAKQRTTFDPLSVPGLPRHADCLRHESAALPALASASWFVAAQLVGFSRKIQRMSKGKQSGARALRLLLITAVSITAAVMNTAMDAPDEFPAFRPGDRILFQGDSITDAGRTRAPDPAAGLGEGYVSIIAARATALYPGRRLAFVNRGISGDKAYHLASR